MNSIKWRCCTNKIQDQIPNESSFGCHAVLTFERQAKSESEGLIGEVKIMMHCMIGYHFSPAWLSQLHTKHPQLTVDLTINDQVKLLFREVEIAVQIERPTQADLIVQRVGRLKLGLYASKAYFAQHPIHLLHELPDHPLIGFERNTDFMDHAQKLTIKIKREHFVIRTDQWAMHPFFVQQGIGVGILPIPIAEDMGLCRVCPDFTLEYSDLYMTAHPALRRNPHIRLVWDHLHDALKAMFGE